MSKAIVLLGDLGSEHEGFPPTPVIAGSPDVLIDGKPAARVGDPLAPHSKPKHPPHPRTIAAGSSTVMINGKPAAVTGGAISCGGVTIGSGSVIIGDAYTRAPFSGIPQMSSDSSGLKTRGGTHSEGARLPGGVTIESGSSGNGTSGIMEALNGRESLRGQGNRSDGSNGTGGRSVARRRLRIGVFFDGTGNHKDNDRRLTDRDVTNVAKLHDLYDRTESLDRIYVAGPGTTEGQVTEDGVHAPSDLAGLALGIGEHGGHSRILSAVQQVRDLLKVREPTELELDVFGFSRGAALARYFVNLVNEWPATLMFPEINGPDLFAPAIKLSNVKTFPADVKARVRFVGLFDTVGSFYLPGNDRNLDFNLHLGAESADHVVHLTAYHEIRKNFPLSSIRGASGLPANFMEQSLPGAHSDVGGGYENPDKDIRNFETFPVRVFSGHGGNTRTIRIAQEKIAAMNESDSRNIQARVVGMDVIAEERRPTRKELAIYSLHKMYTYAVDAGVPLVEITKEQPEFGLPEHLEQAINDWKADGAELSAARQYLAGYIHTSHRAGSIAHGPESSGVRRRFLNKPHQAISAATGVEL
ncbi:type VI secretion system PAAR protein [Marinobacter sp.]|uniref:type VI secretion system PAAR protein n=1 Tax=Marinobacter sp. TaxID=50741 RepID=UPI0034A462D6